MLRREKLQRTIESTSKSLFASKAVMADFYIKNKSRFKQSIAFRPATEALSEVDYKRYVEREYIPACDPYQSLKEVVTLC